MDCDGPTPMRGNIVPLRSYTRQRTPTGSNDSGTRTAVVPGDSGDTPRSLRRKMHRAMGHRSPDTAASAKRCETLSEIAAGHGAGTAAELMGVPAPRRPPVIPESSRLLGRQPKTVRDGVLARWDPRRSIAMVGEAIQPTDFSTPSRCRSAASAAPVIPQPLMPRTRCGPGVCLAKGEPWWEALDRMQP